MFGALDSRTDAFSDCVFDRGKATELIDFQAHIVTQYPAGKSRIILDNLGTNRARSMQAWLASHPRVRLYFPPCYTRQTNLVEIVR